MTQRILCGEKQETKLSAVARPQDVTADNTILSANLADAKIEYSGKGILGNRQREGVISKVLSFLF